MKYAPSFLRKVGRAIVHRRGKLETELAYWQKRKNIEHDLSNDHYIWFYTSHFGLPLSFYEQKRVLDIGCGPRGSLEWADNALERVGLDPLADSYLNMGCNQHKMQYVAANAESIPFSDGYFDVVCSFNSLDHVDDLDQAISEIIRVTVAGGIFLLLTDVNHEPTQCEPIWFSWDIVDKFVPYMRILDVRNHEKCTNGLYQSIARDVSYDHSDSRSRYGILSAKCQKI